MAQMADEGGLSDTCFTGQDSEARFIGKPGKNSTDALDVVATEIAGLSAGISREWVVDEIEALAIGEH